MLNLAYCSKARLWLGSLDALPLKWTGNMRVRPWGQCILIILTFNGDCNQWWLVKTFNKIVQPNWSCCKCIFLVGSRMSFQYKECTANNNYYILILRVAKWVWNSWMNVTLGIKAEVQSLQDVGNKLKCKTLQLGIWCKIGLPMI